MTTLTRISVVVPTLDTKDLTRACVESVFASRLPKEVDLDVVVVDDGSSDGTAEDLMGRPGLLLLRNETSTGYARAVNRGVTEAKGDVLVLLNSDAEIGEESLARIVETFAAEESTGILGAALVYPDGTPQWSAGPEPDIPWLFAQASGIPAILGRMPGWRQVKPIHRTHPVDVGWVSGAAMAVRASVWSDLGPFDCSYTFYAQDLDFCLRARDKGWRVRLLPEFRVAHRHGATISSRGETTIENTDLGLLWKDLVLWARKRKGEAFARRALAALRSGASLRVLYRRLVLPFVPRERREVFRSETMAISRARAGLLRSDPSLGPFGS